MSNPHYGWLVLLLVATIFAGVLSLGMWMHQRAWTLGWDARAAYDNAVIGDYIQTLESRMCVGWEIPDKPVPDSMSMP